MEIAVVGTPEFTLGFQLAGVTRLHNPADLEETATVLRSLMDTPEVGIVVIDSSDLTQMPEKLRMQLSESITPTVLGLSLIHICRCRRSTLCRSRWSPYH